VEQIRNVETLRLVISPLRDKRHENFPSIQHIGHEKRDGEIEKETPKKQRQRNVTEGEKENRQHKKERKIQEERMERNKRFFKYAASCAMTIRFST
jgi:hypothetical protein